VFFIQENMLIPAQVDGATKTHHTGRQIRNTTMTLNTIVENTEDITKCYAQHGRLFGQRKRVIEKLSRTVCLNKLKLAMQ
jgi:hypothetical protein